nr:hypothetical protein [Mammaliicoccus sp. Marseille-Q6498]
MGEGWVYWIQVIYYLCGILTIIIAGTGIYQLIEMKKENKKNDIILRKKESLNALENFAKYIIPEIDKYNESIRKLSEQDRKNFVRGKWVKENRKLTDMEKKIFLAEYIMKSRKTNIGSILNQLEHLSAYIESEVLDEEILKTPIAHILVAVVEENIATLLTSSELNSAPFKNLYAVYNRWEKWVKKEKLHKDKSIIENEIKSLENQ